MCGFTTILTASSFDQALAHQAPELRTRPTRARKCIRHQRTYASTLYSLRSDSGPG